MSEAIRQTMMSPGWKEIKVRAEEAVKAAHYDALAEQDPSKYPEKHRIAWAASYALRTFTEALEELNEHPTD